MDSSEEEAVSSSGDQYEDSEGEELLSDNKEEYILKRALDNSVSSNGDQHEDSKTEELSSGTESGYAHKRALVDAVSSSDEQYEDSEAQELSDNEREYAQKHTLFDAPSSTKRLKMDNIASELPHEQKKIKNGLFKPPTAEELNRVRETENLYSSNLFRLQIKELLKEVKVKQKYHTLFNKWLEDFAQFLGNLPELEEVKVSELSERTGQRKFIKALRDMHHSSLNADQDVVLKFVKPEKYDIVGLHKIDALLGPKLTVDVTIAMPKKCFLEKDFLNNRYLVKRAYYVSYIYLHLKKKKLCSHSSHVDNNSVLHIILPASEKIDINLYVTPAENTFKLARFEPDKNNIREHLYDNFSDLDKTLLKEVGTPFYNSRLLHDLTINSNWDFAENVLKDLKNVQDGIKLLSVWLRQRDLYSNEDFSEILLVQTVVYLTLKRKINKHMSSYQVIRNFWVFLSTTNWHEEPISICDDVKSNTFQAFREDFDVVFLDKSGSYNLAAFLNKNVYMKLRSEAELAIGFLDDIKFDSFRALFMTNMKLEIQYDAILILKDDQGFKNVYNTISTTEKYKYVGCFQTLIVNNILKSLCKGLNKRIINIVPILNEENEDFTTLYFGITLNPSEAFKVTEKGPPSNSREAVEFTKFWGTLSECRRFADGSICEAVYFPAMTFQDKRKLFKEVIDFVVREKLKVQEHVVIADEFEKVLVLNNYKTPFPVGTNEEASTNIIRIFDDLSKKLRDCNLPLEITAVQGVSEVFSYTSLFPPVPTSYRWGGKLTTLEEDNIIFNRKAKFGSVPKYCEPIECVIQLGMNSKWPHNLEALRNLKVGFYIELSNILSKKFQIVSAVKPGFIDVFYQGLVFRFRLYNPREISALKKSLDSNGVTTFKDTNESVELEKNLVILPRIISALHGIQSENPSYGPSTALIKRWLRSQLIDEYNVPDIVIDLLNASLYLSGAPYSSPNLPQVAFLRFLCHLSEFDWNLHLTVVNFNDELTKEVIDNFEAHFQQNRQNYPPLCIITPYDDGKSLFSKECTKEVLRRLTLLAKTACEVIQIANLIQSFPTTQLFVPNLGGYNVLIHLKPLLNPRRHQQVDFANESENTVELQDYDEKESTKMPIVDFNPVKSYLKELREKYGTFALFFYDTYGGNVIAVLWQPKALESKPFKMSHIAGRKLMDGNLILDTEAIVADFCVLGDGLVKAIQRCN